MREVRPLTAADIDAAVAIRSFAQWGRVDDDHKQRFARSVPRSLGSFQDGTLAAIATMHEFDVYVGGSKVTFGGLAGVATSPTHRRKGHVAGLLRAWYERLHDDGIGLSGEFPFDPSFYARYGYQTLVNGCVFDMPVERLPRGAHDAVEIGPDRWAELAPIHAAYARRFSLALARTDAMRDHWRTVLAPFWATTPFHAFLMEDAYLIFSVDDSQDAPTYPKVLVRDVAYASPAGRDAVFAFLADLAGRVARVRIHLPPGDPLLAMWSSWYATESISYQVRVVDVERALAPLRGEHERSFSLLLRDGECPWNDGVFDVQLTADGCSAKRSPSAARAVGPGAADVALDVNTLAALLFGAVDPAAAVATGLAEGDGGAIIDLARLVSGCPTYVSTADHF